MKREGREGGRTRGKVCCGGALDGESALAFCIGTSNGSLPFLRSQQKVSLAEAHQGAFQRISSRC